MKTLLIAFLTLLGMSVIAPKAEAGDRYRNGYGYGYRTYYPSYGYRNYPRYRYYGYAPRYYYWPSRYYYNGRCYPRYGEPSLTVRFGY